jgi:peptidoglycan/xylan/chitin deacetylase (PgdA/CDA1 family)
MARQSVIDVGAHTVTHPPLTVLAPDACRIEVASSKAECERLLGRPVVGFSYPHGEFDVHTKAIVEEAGFAWACSAQDDAMRDGDIDVFELPRIQVLNWNGRELLRALRT